MTLQCAYYIVFWDVTYVAATLSVYFLPSFDICMQFVIALFKASYCFSITLCKILSMFSRWSSILHAGDAKTSSVCNSDGHCCQIDKSVLSEGHEKRSLPSNYAIEEVASIKGCSYWLTCVGKSSILQENLFLWKKNWKKAIFESIFSIKKIVRISFIK